MPAGSAPERSTVDEVLDLLLGEAALDDARVGDPALMTGAETHLAVEHDREAACRRWRRSPRRTRRPPSWVRLKLDHRLVELAEAGRARSSGRGR